MKPVQFRRSTGAFTLIELLVVIAIIAVLMGLALPAFQSVQDSAKRAQAKNDLTQMVSAINAFYTEYGQYPCGAQQGNDAQDFFAGDDNANSGVFDVLRADPNNGNVKTYNPKVIAFMQAPIAKDPNKPRSGIGGNGRFYDPWGAAYRVKMDNNYNNQLENPYTQSTGAGFDPIQAGVIAWSLGKDGAGAKTGAKGAGGSKSTGASKDDILSWQ